MPKIILDYDPNLQDFANSAYRYCTDWFGIPTDEDWPCHIVQFRSNYCRRSPLFRQYFITVKESYRTQEQSKATIAHEMYHRVTRLRRGLREQPWLDEALAFLVSQRILRAEGLSDYAEFRIAHIRDRTSESALRAVQAMSKWRYLLGMPTWFYDTVSILGSELETMLEWNLVCLLADSRSWDEWLYHVPPEKRKCVSDLLII